ncbi:MAG: SDR family NAD(P)-dependent oxidoreductase [Ignavibacteriaceae bacterium]|jgi:NADP-dependent 3-hydroxy acid dehydrogenase YdfG
MEINENKFAFVTGTSSGIGKATANELLKLGWKVIGTARRNVDINDKNYVHLKIDLSDINNLENQLAKQLKLKISDKKYDRIALVNNAAGTGELLRFEELDPKKLSELYILNTVTPIWLSGIFFKNKNEKTRLRIIDISTGAAHNAYPGLTPYCGTKAALLISGKILAIENKEDKSLAIRSYEPGTVDTEMQLKVRSEEPEIFPSANVFKSLKANNMLADPNVVAKDIVDFLEDNEPGYSEKRFGKD